MIGQIAIFTIISAVMVNELGITLYIYKEIGITSNLKPSNALATLVEGPYSSQHTIFLFNNDRMLAVGGGIEVTVLSHTHGRPSTASYTGA